jgi:hypothetical protein
MTIREGIYKVIKDYSHGKCHECGTILANHRLTVCDHCLRRFCDEHIFVGIDTGEMHLKNYCGECLELVGIVPDNDEKKGSFGESYTKTEGYNHNNGKTHNHNENKQINVSLLKKDEATMEEQTKTKSYYNGLSKPITYSNGKIKTHDITKWEYKSVFLAIDSDIEIDEQILEHIQKDYLNVFPANREENGNNYESNPELIGIEKLNKLGEEGWEVITSIPKTKSILMMKRNGKPTSSVSGNITGAYIILKRPKR